MRLTMLSWLRSWRILISLRAVMGNPSFSFSISTFFRATILFLLVRKRAWSTGGRNNKWMASVLLFLWLAGWFHFLPPYLEDFSERALSNLGHLLILVHPGAEFEVKLFQVLVNVSCFVGMAATWISMGRGRGSGNGGRWSFMYSFNRVTTTFLSLSPYLDAFEWWCWLLWWWWELIGRPDEAIFAMKMTT